MSREDLHAMFTELAQDVSGAELVAPAVARAARVRRRRRAVIGATLAVFVLSTVSIAIWGPTGPPVMPATSPGPTSSIATRVDRLPANLVAEPPATYWPASINPTANTPTLAEAPISHAVLLFSPFDRAAQSDESDGRAPPIYVYGEGSVNGGSGSGTFHWARVETALSETRDVDGNRAMPLDQNSLGPMGRRAAFAQPDSVVIVNLATGAEDRIPLPGLNEDVSWLPDGRHVLVSSATKTWLVDRETRSAVPAAASGASVTALVGGGSGVTTLDVAPDGDAGPMLRYYDDGGSLEASHRPVNEGAGSPYQISYLGPRGWRYGPFIAQAATGRVGSRPGDFIVVVDDRDAAVSRILDLGAQDTKGCCAVLGWINSDQVLVSTDKQGLLKWQLSTGTVSRLTQPVAGAISAAPTGCDWSITIAGVTNSCMS